jgi:hypothetical protein
MGREAPIVAGRPAGNVAAAMDFGVWSDHRIPDDRSGWHPMVQRFYDYWLSVAPPGQLPGRQHIAPEDLAPLLSRLWLVDVYRNPLRFRYRLVGTAVVESIHRELTGGWLDEVQPEIIHIATVHDRYHFVAETGRPTWRRGRTHWERDPLHRTIENCLVPLAADGKTVDKILAVNVLFDGNGNEIKF